MKFRQLGSTGVRVSALALGTALFGVAPDEREAGRLVAHALDQGINFIDCANSYGNQARFDRPGCRPADQRASAEEIVGAAIQGKRDQVVLCSKSMEPVGPGVNDRGLSRLHIFNQVEASLRRFRTDHIDVYYAHHPDPATPIEETLRAYDDLIAQGKLRYCALSTFMPTQMVEALWRADKLGLRAPVCNQVPYNLSNREHERDLIPACLRLGLSLTAFSPLAGGLFTSGRADREFLGHKRWGGPSFDTRQLALAEQLDVLAQSLGLSASALAIAWLISRPAVAAAIVGPETLAELDDALAAAQLDLDPALLDRIDAIGKPSFAYY